jgi:tripeptidyl-peptidase-1
MVDVGNTPNPPILFSVRYFKPSIFRSASLFSYGDDEVSLSVDYTSRVNVEFQKKGLRGISILFASGDSGVGGDYGADCQAFVPSFPASSPFVTTVGGTDLQGWFEVWLNEVVVRE